MSENKTKRWRRNQSALMCRSCHFNRALNDEFSVKFWMLVLIFFRPTLKSDLKEVQFTQNYHPYNTLKFQNLAVVKKHNNNKYSKFNTEFIIWHPVKMTWSGYYSKIIKLQKIWKNTRKIRVTFQIWLDSIKTERRSYM